MNTARTILILSGIAIVGLVGYQIGIGQNIAAQLPAGAASAVAYGYPYWHFGFGFGFFGLLFPILFFFLFFGLVRAAFGRGRGWGGHGPGMPGGGWGDPRSRLEEWHREAHGEKPSSTPKPPA